MYVDPNFKTKKKFKEAVAAAKPVYFYQPGIGPEAPETGTIYVEGPHYPEPHTWYAEVRLENGKVVRIR